MNKFADELKAGDKLADGRTIIYVSTHDGKTFLKCDDDIKVWPTTPTRRFAVES